MRLNDYRVWKYLHQRFEPINVVWRFQHPAFAGRMQLEILQESLLPEITWSQISASQKFFVTRHVASGHKFLRQKSVAMNRNTFMRRFRAHRVNRVSPGREPAKPPQTKSRLTNAPLRVFSISVPRRDWKHYFPNTRRATGRMLRKQFVQISRAAPRHSDNEDWRLDRQRRDSVFIPFPLF